jgi:hypothetical protein
MGEFVMDNERAGDLRPSGLRGRRTLGKWLGWLAVLCLIQLVGGHFIWGIRAQGRLDATLRTLHDSGEPIYPGDFDTPVPPPGQNAADDLIAAGDLIRRRGAEAKAFDLLEMDLPLTEKEIEVITAELGQRREAIELAESAARKSQVHWAIDHSIPSMMVDAGPRLNGARGVATTLQADALLAHQRGDDALALTRIVQIRALARLMDAQGSLIPHLVALGMEAMASDLAGKIACDLRIGGERGASAAAVRALIDDLLDDRATRAGMVNALRGERRDLWLTVNHMLAGTLVIPSGNSRSSSPPPGEPATPSIKSYAIRPVFINDADLMVRVNTKVIEEFQRSQDWPTFKAKCDIDRLFPEIQKRPMLHVLSGILLPSYGRAITTQYRLITDERLAGVALAVRAFAVAHDGRLPASLDELAPGYLSAVPLDPMAGGGAKLRWRFGGSPDPIVYSVGDDSTDNEGSEAPVGRATPGEPVPRWQARDAVMHLTRQARFVRPAEE